MLKIYHNLMSWWYFRKMEYADSQIEHWLDLLDVAYSIEDCEVRRGVELHIHALNESKLKYHALYLKHYVKSTT